MSRSFEIPAGRRAFLAAALTALVIGLGAPCAQSQRRVEQIGFTNTVWRFEASGADPGVDWRSPTFDDASWPSGRGLFGFETTPEIYPYPFNTVFDPFDPNIVTYYFRTHFEVAASDLVFPLTLICSNLVDEGLFVYLNSNLVQAIRGTGEPGIEAIVGPVNISTTGLRVGDNVIAVEVHQAGAGGSDVAFGLSLTAIVPTAVSITNQPQSHTNVVGIPIVLSVGVAGGPAVYQWQRNDGSGTFINVPGATSNSFTHTPSVAGAVTYQVVVSNEVNSVTSDPATVMTIPDTFGPRMLSAAVLEEATRTNRIWITWSERLRTSTVVLESRTNFQVIMFPSNLRVAISNVQYNPSPSPPLVNGPFVVLTMNTTNWHVGSNYYVSVGGVKDSTGNVIAPDSRIPVSWPHKESIFGFAQLWSFHTGSLFEPEIFEQPWYATNYVESGPWWGQGVGPFCAGTVHACPFDFGNSCETTIGLHPSLFRTTFVAPTNPGSPSYLKFSLVLDDAVVIYLNGSELFRYNLPPAPTPLTAQTKALTTTVNAFCVTNLVSVTNLHPGTNWLAAAVFPSADPSDTDAVFYLLLDHLGFFTGPLPEVPIPRLNIAPTGVNGFRLWWDAPGYALESTTNLSFTDGVPVGAWLEVTNMSNPFIDVLNGERRFFRLRQ